MKFSDAMSRDLLPETRASARRGAAGGGGIASTRPSTPLPRRSSTAPAAACYRAAAAKVGDNGPPITHALECQFVGISSRWPRHGILHRTAAD